jgi:hypothetical protein
MGGRGAVRLGVVRPGTDGALLRLDLLGLEIPPGTAILLAGPPGVGKTSMALEMAFAALAQGRPALYVTWEHRAEQILAWTAGHPDPLRAELLVLAGGRSTTLFDVERALEAARMGPGGIRRGLLILDYLQLVPIPPMPGRIWRPGDGAVEAFRWGLEWAARSGGVLLGISAADPAGWDPRRALMGALPAEAVEMAYDADLVLGLYPDGPGRVRWKLEKNRLGPAQEGRLAFDGARRRFARLEGGDGAKAAGRGA